jgi:hypothetical protein
VLVLLAGAPGCKREDPQIRALTERASQADEAAQQLRQAWRDQFRRFSLVGMKPLPPGPLPLQLTPEQRLALEARVRIEKNSSRRALLQEILDQDGEVKAQTERLRGLQAALPAPEVASPHDSHYGLALRFLQGRGQSLEQARKTLSRVALSDRLAPGFEVYHFYVAGEYGTWVSQGRAVATPRELARLEPEPSTAARDQALARGRRLQRELGLLEGQRKLIEQDIAAIQSERAKFLEDRTQLLSENTQQLAQLNSLHYLVGVRDALEAQGVIEVPLLGKDHSGRSWRDGLFTQHLDLRAATSLVIRAQDLGLRQISKVIVVPGSYLADEHYRLTFSADRRSATVDLLDLPRFKNDKVVFAVVE